jgi:tRNA A37 methylthiotransferase MiaB
MIEEHTSQGWRGRTDTNKIVSLKDFDGQAGQLISVKITNASANGLSGKMIA